MEGWDGDYIFFLKNHPSFPWLNQLTEDIYLFLQMNCSAIMEIQLWESNLSFSGFSFTRDIPSWGVDKEKGDKHILMSTTNQGLYGYKLM